jgi:hypothetical protein
MESYLLNSSRIKIKIGTLYQNRTLKYLVPSLNYYGPTLKTKLNLVFKLAFGVFDNLLEGSHFEGQKNIFILVDKLVRPNLFENFLQWIKHQEYYVTDYTVGENTNNRQHMFVLAFPQPLEDAYDKFLIGKYSKMYQKEEIQQFFEKKEGIKDILCRREAAKMPFIELVYNTFGERLTPSNLRKEVFEYDLPPDKREEIF